MNFNLQLGNFSIGFGQQKPAPSAVRSFGGAGITNRLNLDWLAPATSPDTELYGVVKKLRDHSRELERTNEYVVRYFDLIENNVVGADGVGLQMKITDPTGKLDTMACKLVRDAWLEWTEREFCTVSGKQCWHEVENMMLRCAARDGGGLVRHMRGWGNKFGYAIQPLEIDHLDFDYQQRLANGNEVRFGIEFDQWKRPVALYLLRAHPGDIMQERRVRERIPASEILHIYLANRPNQSVGYPWITPVMQALEHLGKYQEAELVAARMEACKGYVIEQGNPDGYQGSTDSQGRNSQDMAPGMAMILDPGQKYVGIDPTHPNTAHGDYVKSRLRGIAAGLGVNYNSLANDLESVNYSSMRAGKLEEIEEYKNIQSWLIESLHTPVFSAWLEMALISGAIKSLNGVPMPVSKFQKFNAPDWKPRRWPWVDPKKDADAAVLLIQNGLKSRRSIISEMGGDIEEVFAEMQADDELADAHDLEFPDGNDGKMEVADTEDSTETPASGVKPKLTSGKGENGNED